MLVELAEKVALVTGAGSGIGRGVAEVLAGRGMKLVLADINDEALEDTAKALSVVGGAYITAQLDICDADGWQALVARAEVELGPVQLLCNVAGVTAAPGPLLDMPAEAWSWIIETNLTGTYHGVVTVARRLKALGLPGHILNTSSSQGLYGAPNFAAYNASKFAIMGLSETLRIELVNDNIGVSVVCPGPTRGNILASSAKIAPHLVKIDQLRVRGGFSHFQMPAEVAEKIVQGIERNQLFIITHPEYRQVLEQRWEALSIAIGTDINAEAAANINDNEMPSLNCYHEANPKED
jgi:NAD(P)-dependent dehydrogenase (short-subunit alcohol dehydrogenase family)